MFSEPFESEASILSEHFPRLIDDSSWLRLRYLFIRDAYTLFTRVSE